MILLFLVSIFVFFTLIYNLLRHKKKLHPWQRKNLTLTQLNDPTLFSTHNHCTIRFLGGFLSAKRYENRLLFHKQQNLEPLACGVTQTMIGKFESAIHNYVVLQRDEHKPFILKLPLLKNMHPGLRWNQNWEDCRLFYYQIPNKTGRLFLTGTVLTKNNVRIGMVELDHTKPNFPVKRGFVLGSDQELGLVESQKMQKNYILFANDKNEACILTHACPRWTVYRINLDTGEMFGKSQVDSTLFFHEEISASLLVRCSSPMVQWSESTYLCALHTRDQDKPGRAPRYRTIFVEFESRWPYRLLRKSKIFQFIHPSRRVEFVAGLCEFDEETLLVSLGIDDLEAKSIKISKNKVFSK